eukprot:CAMPEP_0176211228 /NCGR_PEP_ID=MMETSP0121_2-20121125/14545_1 /TAXON_ID=160619 /ORGANISM="Kryptoperidinium foliaceum, Strain CCMP 1326" /LENGTH=255 /DNA_ID=CAMNT_0017550273 /DNA_START=73 /DNA_END=837 /DNA_ORIENTATION=+
MARAALLSALLCFFLTRCVVVGAAVAKVRQQVGRARLAQLSSESSFVRTLAFKHTLRVCNAYPYSAPMEIFHGKTQITDPPLPYKACREFSPPIRDGDKLQFKIGGSNAGSFAISELPNNDAVLVLIVYRHDAISSAVAFESHIFSNLINAQIAVLDTYKGHAEAQPRIQDASSAKTSRSEELRYDSVVAVNPGIYEVVLQSEDREMKARAELVALNRESYVVVRCGVEAQEGQSYSQELIVFPHSDPKMLTGSA